jgi:hypothetical protein
MIGEVILMGEFIRRYHDFVYAESMNFTAPARPPLYVHMKILNLLWNSFQTFPLTKENTQVLQEPKG